jgi:hypothetical protein
LRWSTVGKFSFSHPSFERAGPLRAPARAHRFRGLRNGTNNDVSSKIQNTNPLTLSQWHLLRCGCSASRHEGERGTAKPAPSATKLYSPTAQRCPPKVLYPLCGGRPERARESHPLCACDNVGQAQTKCWVMHHVWKNLKHIRVRGPAAYFLWFCLFNASNFAFHWRHISAHSGRFLIHEMTALLSRGTNRLRVPWLDTKTPSSPSTLRDVCTARPGKSIWNYRNTTKERFWVLAGCWNCGTPKLSQPSLLA